MALNIRTLSLPLVQDFGGDNKQVFALHAPAGDEGGKIRILSAAAVNGAATSGGNHFSLALHRYSSAGTPAVNGTIAAAVGGSPDYWAAGVPKTFTVDDDYGLLSEGEWLVLQYNEAGTGNPTSCLVDVKYLQGN